MADTLVLRRLHQELIELRSDRELLRFLGLVQLRINVEHRPTAALVEVQQTVVSTEL